MKLISKHVWIIGAGIFIFLLLFVFPAMKHSFYDFDRNFRVNHPRIWVDMSRIESYRKIAPHYNDNMSDLDNAFFYLVCGEQKYFLKVKNSIGKLDFNDVYSLRNIALMYDWCYSGFSKEERAVIAKKMLDASEKIMANGRFFRSFHNMMYENSLAIALVAIALYDEYPEAKRIFKFAKFQYDDAVCMMEDLFKDGDWPEGFCYARHVNLAMCEYLLAIDSAFGVDILKNSNHFKNAVYFLIYGTHPDGTANNVGDNDYPYVKWRDKLLVRMLAWKFNNGYAKNFFNTGFKDVEYPYLFCDVLWPIENIEEKSVSELPKARIFRGTGIIFARSGVGVTDVFFSFKCGDYFGDHSHYDANSFTVYKNAPVLLDAGIYDSEDWSLKNMSRAHMFNYYQRAVAHNTVLVYDKDEKFYGYENKPLVNDAGQKVMLWIDKGNGSSPADYRHLEKGFSFSRIWFFNKNKFDVASIKKFKSNDYFCYVEADATRSYSSKKLKKFIRRMFFVYPNIFIIYDDIAAKKNEHKKKFILHTQDEPIFENGMFYIPMREGYLNGCVFHQEEYVLTKVGGDGREFCVNDENFEPLRQTFDRGETPGKWRIEIAPKKENIKDRFLVFMTVLDAKVNMHEKVDFIENSRGVSLVFRNAVGDYDISFDKNGAILGVVIKKQGKIIFKEDI